MREKEISLKKYELKTFVFTLTKEFEEKLDFTK